ncbi:hypothetical protein [Salinigranum halophilum]|uniref:hypothetical protein n=1 Tax=Salinigranum halophilum TaxID=2565931 RepID=UPI00115EFD83|nr:hypothetical protein [Salinigranum halophilum]
MKSGTGDDPFGDLVSEERGDEEASESPTETTSETTDDEPAADVAVDAATDTDGDADTETDTTSALDVDGAGDDDGIPWVLRRRSVKDDRPNVTQFFLRDETDRAERRFRGEVEERLDTDVYLLDLREAAYVVAMQHPDEVASLLGRWGYDYRD